MQENVLILQTLMIKLILFLSSNIHVLYWHFDELTLTLTLSERLQGFITLFQRIFGPQYFFLILVPLIMPMMLGLTRQEISISSKRSILISRF